VARAAASVKSDVNQATKEVLSKIQMVEQSMMSGGGSGTNNQMMSSSDIHGSSSPAIQEIDEEVAIRNANHETIEQGSPRAMGQSVKRR
jgi:hypothetical protein